MCGSGALAQLTELELHYNRIGDAGVTALASACAGGALAQLTRLELQSNLIGDAGVAALASACARGAVPKCKVNAGKYIGLYGNPASEKAMQAVQDAIKNRSIAARQRVLQLQIKAPPSAEPRHDADAREAIRKLKSADSRLTAKQVHAMLQQTEGAGARRFDLTLSAVKRLCSEIRGEAEGPH